MPGFAESPADEHFISESVDALLDRWNAPTGHFPLINRMFVERGSKADWEMLSVLHYKSHAPSPGPRYFKLTLEGETIGVLVTAMPRGMLRDRHRVFPKLGDFKDNNNVINTQRYLYINDNFRVISRFVVDTMYRGVGIGYRMMNLVARMERARFIEIQSSMSKFNQFGQRAGFRFVKPEPPAKHDVGMKFFRQNFSADPRDYEAMIDEVMAQSPAIQAKMTARIKEFYYKHAATEKTGDRRGERGSSRVDDMTLREVLRNLQQLVMASPMYGFYENPDYTHDVPERLPLTAFDEQGFRAPLARIIHARH